MTEHEERALAEVIRAARTVQDYLWSGDGNVRFGGSLDIWRQLLQKRIDKLAEVDPARPGAAVEVRKRLLQTGALAVALIGVLDNKGLPGPVGSRR